MNDQGTFKHSFSLNFSIKAEVLCFAGTESVDTYRQTRILHLPCAFEIFDVVELNSARVVPLQCV